MMKAFYIHFIPDNDAGDIVREKIEEIQVPIEKCFNEDTYKEILAYQCNGNVYKILNEEQQLKEDEVRLIMDGEFKYVAS